MYRGKIKRVHFVGIGGSGMSGIAEVLINMGYRVSGSDLKTTNTTERLKNMGAAVFRGHMEEFVRGADCVVYSSAVKKTNPELAEARRLHIPIIPRAEMLAELMRMKYGVAVAGTHGKTTTTSMIGTILAHAGMDPTIVTGGKLNSLGSNAKLGKGEFLIAEADESDGSFLRLSPAVAVVTNIDREHMDHYGNMEEVKRGYIEFMNKVPFYGCVVACLDHPAVREILPVVSRRRITYGLSSESDVRAAAITQSPGRVAFDIFVDSVRAGAAALNVAGVHNVVNALSAFSVAKELGLSVDAIIEGLREFKGVERRFQIKGVISEVMVVDDYGHHPVEIKAVLRAAKEGWKKRTIVIFQPHRYSRTKDLFMEFVCAFDDADAVFVTDVYPAGEENTCGVGSSGLCEAIKEHGHKRVFHVPGVENIAEEVASIVKPGDMVITLGAGDVWKAADALLAGLRAKNTIKAGG